MEYQATIGMEVHAQILTRSKMFCACSAEYASAPPNSHTCPICLGMPGTLPVANAAAIEATVRTGLALACEIPAYSKFDRKNYPYPDLPKGYQISQYDLPLCRNGALEIEVQGETRRIRIRRVHLEEDTARLVHQGDASLIDFNRSGVPLMEIVTESDLHSAEEAWAYLVKLRTILRCLGVSTGNMEEGAMRCEANISIAPVGAETLGTKVEVKNLNSFRSVRQAIAYELERQAQVLDSGGRVQQVTMGWDEDHHRTVFQRSKEQAEDYRYFPEPDIPPLEPAREWVEALRAALPELPDVRQRRFVEQYALRPQDAGLLVEECAVADFYESAVAAAQAAEPRAVANWVLGELLRLLRESGQEITASKLSPTRLAELVDLVARDTINATVGKEVLAAMLAEDKSAADIVADRGLGQISDEDLLRQAIAEALERNPKAVQDYRDGKEAALRFLIGQVMRATRGKANARVAEAMLSDTLRSGQE